MARISYAAVPAHRISESILPLRGLRGEVQSVFRGAVNVIADGWLVTIAVPSAGGLPNGFLIDKPTDLRLLGVRLGDAVTGGDDAVTLPAVRLRIELHDDRRWAPRLIARPPAETAEAWQRNRATAWQAAADRSSTTGFGPLLRRIGRKETGHYLSSFCLCAAPSIGVIRSSLDWSDTDTAAGAAVELVGLGPGLTPSGDDFVVGLAAALTAAGNPSGIEIASRCARQARERTTLVAATLLRHAARGEFGERLHVLLAALLGHDLAAVPAAIDAAASWGASSGVDCLLGVLVGLDAATGLASAS